MNTKFCKEMRSLIDKIDGARVVDITNTRKQHLQFLVSVPAGKRKLILANSPGDHRGRLNALSMVKRWTRETASV